MRAALARWVSDADAFHHVQRFGLSGIPAQLAHVPARRDDYYLSLVGELFHRVREPFDDPVDWSRLGNALTQAGARSRDGTPITPGVLPAETALFAAAAFYFGGYSASAYLTLKAASQGEIGATQQACYELLARPARIQSEAVRDLVDAVRRGSRERIAQIATAAAVSEVQALALGPEEWVGACLFRRLVDRFARTNLRAVLPPLPDGFWDSLVRSLLSRKPPAWDFFPSQIDALQRGLLSSDETFSLQMPTGAGKTALSEALLYHHLKTHPTGVAVLLVPYRSLASELRGTLVRNLNQMGFSSRCAYGGTVPTGDEIRQLDETRAIVATPEALSGLLSAHPDFFGRITLVICDEGHLLDGGGRGVGLELLLARLRGRPVGKPRFVFVSAIVPNIEEINGWLGGTPTTVVRSDYRPALAEFAVLRVAGSGADMRVNLHLHPHEAEPTRFAVDGFLTRDDFRFRNPSTGRLNTYSFGSVKSQALATARKALTLGAVAVFAANKRGDQGALGLAEELLLQLDHPLSLPAPLHFVRDAAKLQEAAEYFGLEYGYDWVGTRALAAGAVLHHGDIPQESREVVEALIRREDVRLAICTSTLAEGVNLPIRTLVLYSVQRRRPNGPAESLLTRDIKNLVGRAGRAGTTTKGLVVCANSGQWPLVEPVAKQEPGETVRGALHRLVAALRRFLRQQNLVLTNDILEGSAALHTLIDGIDATLIDLAAEEIGDEELVRIASDLAGQTFAARQVDGETLVVMRRVFELRADRVAGMRASGRLRWIRETGTRARMLTSIESSLLPLRTRWDDIADPIDRGLIEVMVEWAWTQADIAEALKEAYRDEQPSQPAFVETVRLWVEGTSLFEMARRARVDVNAMLGIHSRVLTYVFQVAVEQAVGLLRKLLEGRGDTLAPAVGDFPEHLRFGVPSAAARILAMGGVRHRRAAVALGRSPEVVAAMQADVARVFPTARQLLADRDRWLPSLGALVLERTIEDVAEQGGREDQRA